MKNIAFMRGHAKPEQVWTGGGGTMGVRTWEAQSTYEFYAGFKQKCHTALTNGIPAWRTCTCNMADPAAFDTSTQTCKTATPVKVRAVCTCSWL